MNDTELQWIAEVEGEDFGDCAAVGVFRYDRPPIRLKVGDSEGFAQGYFTAVEARAIAQALQDAAAQAEEFDAPSSGGGSE